MPCTCDRDGYPCPEHYADYVRSYEDAAEREAERQRQEHEAGRGYCPACGEELICGECVSKPCREVAFREHFMAEIEPSAWEEHDEGEPCSIHDWHEPEIEADGGDVDVFRTCRRCGRTERQRLQSEPEAPNCYVPGEGWRVI